MNQLFGQSADPVRPGEIDLGPSSAAVRPLPVGSAEQAFFHLDIKRSLQLHWRLARAVAIAGAALGVLYFLGQVFVLKSWPAYKSESIVYVQPTPPKVLEPSQGGSPRWPYDTNTYESYIQQQMMNVSRNDVLIDAIHKMNGWQRPGESDQAATQRLVRLLTVTREGSAYQFSISARADNPATAAQIANAVTASYIESASRDERTGDAQRLQMLREERDRIQNALAADRAEQDELNKQLGVASVGSAAPDHFDEDITETRTELMKAQADHDAAEAKFASMGAGNGPSSAAIDAAADEMIASDAGLVSMKTALNTRRATLISQMANLTLVNPQYKQDEVELAKINNTLDAMMKDLRAKAAARIQLQLRADLQRTGGVESQLNGQLRQLVGAAGSATPKLQRSSDLAADITRLQARFATVDEQLHNLLLEDSAPAAAYQVMPAVAPLTRTKSGVLRNAVLITFAGLFFGILAAVAALKLDPKVYIASDVELLLGFPPMAQLPDFNEVSSGVSEEYLLRLASAIEHARKQSGLRSCIFTGTGSGAGVSTLVNRVRAMLEAMGRPTVLVDATGAVAPAPLAGTNGPEGAPGLLPVERGSRPTALLQQMAEETETREESLVLTDTTPLAVSAETEYLARFGDCVIVVIESGVTTRAELRQAAATLQRLDVGAVGFVLNRVGLAKADPAFRLSVEAIEKHLQAQGSTVARRTEQSKSYLLQEPAAGGIDSQPARKDAPARSLFEPELAAAARFSSPTVSEPAACLPSSMVSAPVAEAAKRFSSSISDAPAPGAAKRLSLPLAAEPPAPLPSPTVSAPSAEAAKHFSSSAAAEPAASRRLPAVPEEPSVPTVAAALPISEPQQPQELEPIQPAANPASDMPWWLGEANRQPEPSRPPVLWQPAKVWTSRRVSAVPELLSVAPHLSPEPQQAWASAPRSWERVPSGSETPSTEAAPGEMRTSEVEEAHANLTSRLGGLRNLLFVLGMKGSHGAEEPAEQHSDAGLNSDPGTERLGAVRPTFVRAIPQDTENAAARSIGGASSRLITAPPEFLPPRPDVIDSRS